MQEDEARLLAAELDGHRAWRVVEVFELYGLHVWGISLELRSNPRHRIDLWYRMTAQKLTMMLAELASNPTRHTNLRVPR